MKFLIAFALFAVAFADVEPFRLREAPAPVIEGYIDYPFVVEIVQSPAAAQESPAVSSTANIVKVVDFVKGQLDTIGAKASFDDAEPLYDRTVKFVDEAVTEEHVNNESLVKVVESPLETAPLDFTVNVVDEVVNDINANESLVKVESAVEKATASGLAVSFVDDVQNYFSSNGSPLYEAGLVNFANEAVNNPATSQAEIAPSFHSYAGISKLIKAAQEEKYVEGSSTVTDVPQIITPTAIQVVENAVNMGHILAVGIEDYYEDSMDVHAYDDGTPANVVRVAEFPRGKDFDNLLLR